MEFGRYILMHVPLAILGAIIVILAVVISVSGLVVFRRFISHQKLKPHNDVSGFMFGTLGVIYAVLLAFTVIVVWENYDEASANVDMEASCIADLFRNTSQLHEPFRDEAWQLIHEYIETIINYDWEATSEGRNDTHILQCQNKLWELFGRFAAKNPTEQVFFEQSVVKFNELAKLRRMRLLQSRSGVDPILWFVLIAGGIITIVFTFFFGAENLKIQITMTILLSVLISLILFTILEFDYPFTGRLSITTAPFENLNVYKTPGQIGQD